MRIIEGHYTGMQYYVANGSEVRMPKADHWYAGQVGQEPITIPFACEGHAEAYVELIEDDVADEIANRDKDDPELDPTELAQVGVTVPSTVEMD